MENIYPGTMLRRHYAYFFLAEAEISAGGRKKPPFLLKNIKYSQLLQHAKLWQIFCLSQSSFNL
jgi:hypothetical protein